MSCGVCSLWHHTYIVVKRYSVTNQSFLFEQNDNGEVKRGLPEDDRWTTSVGKATYSMLKHLEGRSAVSKNFFKRQPVKGHPLILPTCVFWSSSRRFVVVNNRKCLYFYWMCTVELTYERNLYKMDHVFKIYKISRMQRTYLITRSNRRTSILASLFFPS